MIRKESLLGIPYNIYAGPDRLSLSYPKTTNCQRAVQLWFARKGIILDPKQCLSKEASESLGILVAKFASPEEFQRYQSNLLPEDIIFADRKPARKKAISEARKVHSREELFHMAIWLGTLESGEQRNWVTQQFPEVSFYPRNVPLIFHAAYRDQRIDPLRISGTTVSTLDTFSEKYVPALARRIFMRKPDLGYARIA